jgi:phosphotransferase system  glucose/maltose/N-acetylglucosamine-specific IIC component
MNPFVELISGSQSEWLECLPEFQRSSIEDLLRSGKEPSQIAEAWLEAGAAMNTAPFGTSGSAKIFFNHFLDELHDLLCTEGRRENERASVLASFKKGQTTAVAAVTTAVSPYLSSAPAFLAPAVALTMCAISSVGLAAWCKTQTERRQSKNLES